jgi:anthranilate phosphoribosyltransferase
MTTLDLSRVAEAPLTEEETHHLFDDIFAGRLSQTQIMTYLAASAARSPTTGEITGAAGAMRAAMKSITAPELAIDLCGTGGDGHGTLNISTAVSFVVAAAGVPVAKHGNRSMSSKSGAADILEALGVKIDLEPDSAQRVLNQVGLVFLFAQTYHPAMRHVSAARKAIGQRTIFNLLGPLASPARVRRQLVGVFAEEWLTPYAEALRALGCERAMVVHGADGLDELTTTDVTNIANLENGVITLSQVTPEDAGLKRAKLADLKGGDSEHNAQALRQLLSGKRGAYRDIVCLNASAALMVAGAASDIKSGVAITSQVLDGGKARAKLEELITASNT